MARILVIDDQKDIVQLVVKALELQNHNVTGLTSVLDLDKNSLPRFDLILLDIMMPDVLTVYSFAMRFEIRWIAQSSLLQLKRKKQTLSKG